MVPHRGTNCADRTGCGAFRVLWPWIEGLQHIVTSIQLQLKLTGPEEGNTQSFHKLFSSGPEETLKRKKDKLFLTGPEEDSAKRKKKEFNKC